MDAAIKMQGYRTFFSISEPTAVTKYKSSLFFQ